MTYGFCRRCKNISVEITMPIVVIFPKNESEIVTEEDIRINIPGFSSDLDSIVYQTL